jgi:hypothetical protein
MTVTDRTGKVWSIHIWHAPRDGAFEALPYKEKRRQGYAHPEMRPLTRARLHVGPCEAKVGMPCMVEAFVGETRRGEKDSYRPEVGAKVALARAMILAGLDGVDDIRTDIWNGYVKAARLVREIPQYEVHSFTSRIEGMTTGTMSHYIGPFPTVEAAEIAIRKLQKLARRR